MNPNLNKNKTNARKPPTLDEMRGQMGVAMRMQLNTVLAQFLDTYSDEQVEGFLPQDIGEADAWLEDKFSLFTADEDPDIDAMVSGLSTLFMMSFLEMLYDKCGIGEDPTEAAEDGSEGVRDV